MTTAIATATTINLLPWREERRAQQQQDFLMLLAGAAILGALVFLVWNMSVKSAMDNQQSRNRFVESELKQLETQIKEIRELEEQKADLVARMKVIQDLQNNRPSIVYFFDEMVRTLPDGVFYETIERKGPLFTIKGVAESNNRISALMRNLNDSDWFQKPNLVSVKAIDGEGESNTFHLTVEQELGNTGEPEEGNNNKGGAR